MAFSDGPAGVRGIAMDERAPSSSLPCPSALGATWDPGLVGEVAAALGAEARGKDIDVLLAPTIHLMRTPLGGRGFECFAEDPVLTARIAVAYVRGVQSAGVALRGQALHLQRLRDAALDLRRPGGRRTCCVSCTWSRSRRWSGRRACWPSWPATTPSTGPP